MNISIDPTYVTTTGHCIEHLLWLAARDIVFFSTYDPDNEDSKDHYTVCVLCNDTFYYACADAEMLPPGQEVILRDLVERFSWAGPVAWCALARKTEPLEQLRTPQYYEAIEYLKDKMQ